MRLVIFFPFIIKDDGLTNGILEYSTNLNSIFKSLFNPIINFSISSLFLLFSTKGIFSRIKGLFTGSLLTFKRLFSPDIFIILGYKDNFFKLVKATFSFEFANPIFKSSVILLFLRETELLPKTTPIILLLPLFAEAAKLKPAEDVKPVFIPSEPLYCDRNFLFVL